MKLHTLLAVLWAGIASVSALRIFTHDPAPLPRPYPPSRPLDGIEARVLLAQRAGVEDYHTDDLFRSGAIEAVNYFGTRESLFQDSSLRRVIMFVECSDTSEANFKDSTSIPVSPTPSNNSTLNLFLDLARQNSPSIVPPHISDAEALAIVDSKESKRAKLWGQNDIFQHFTSVRNAQRYWNGMLQLNEKAARQWRRMSLTAVVVEKNGEGSGQEMWGTYAMPSSQPHLQKRQQQQEEPLELEQDFKPVQSFSFPASSLANSTGPVRGILPACFTSQSSCESSTLNCSGHGLCQLKYTDKTADDKSPHRQCYACSCSPTTHKSSSGHTLTTYWGGPACQKKDVSVQFWLLVLVTVALMGAVGFAVGSVFSMGSEELPSVIGSGVSGHGAGPRR